MNVLTSSSGRPSRIRYDQSRRRRVRWLWTPRFEALEARDVPAVIFVTTGADSGDGSLRDAINQANAFSTADTIIIKNGVSTISLESSLIYTDSQDLSIKGNDATIQPVSGSEGAFDLFESTGGANLSLQSLTFSAGLKNIDVTVPPGATGTLFVDLNQVTVRDSIQHGLHIDDLTNSTSASVNLSITNSTIVGNGSDPNDFDGIRVDERGEGGIDASFINLTVTENGGDGVELDERDAGDVSFAIYHSSITFNGDANASDLEDGFDVDEGGSGDILGHVVDSIFNNNFEGGLDINEDDGSDPTDSGNLIVFLSNVQGNDNDDKGLDFSEGDAGDLTASLIQVEASRNGQRPENREEGIVLEEAGVGNLVVDLRSVITNNNGDDGVEADEAGDGNLVASFVQFIANDNFDEGIDLDEADAGDLIVVLQNVISNDPLDIT